MVHPSHPSCMLACSHADLTQAAGPHENPMPYECLTTVCGGALCQCTALCSRQAECRGASSKGPCASQRWTPSSGRLTRIAVLPAPPHTCTLGSARCPLLFSHLLWIHFAGGAGAHAVGVQLTLSSQTTAGVVLARLCHEASAHVLS